METRRASGVDRRSVAGVLAAAASTLFSGSKAAAASGPDQIQAFSAVLDRYVAAVNAHDTSAFPEIFTEAYIQHSGRSPSGLQAQIANFKRVFENWPDFQVRVEDRIVGGEKLVARMTFSATHTRSIQGFAPTGKRVVWGSIDIWKMESSRSTGISSMLRPCKNSFGANNGGEAWKARCSRVISISSSWRH
jgi:predicted ester cyclase